MTSALVSILHPSGHATDRRTDEAAGGVGRRNGDGGGGSARAGEGGSAGAADRGEYPGPQAGGARRRSGCEDLSDRGGRAEVAEPGREFHDRDADSRADL